ncbi:MAG: hypothetical protein Q8P84_00740 [Deltaproteobacteria bacterium]|nr:hypothetical protein [Deltaproteobacteria bacterium]
MATPENVMEFIWATVDKGPDGCVHYPLEFVDFLMDFGFVDTKKYSKEAWRAAFEPFKQPDGHFKLSRDEFLTLAKYRYAGEVKIPFDPMRINEGKYTDEGFGQLLNESIAPSCGLEAPTLNKFVEELKKEFRQPDDLILIKTEAKQKIKKLLEENPSPLRRLEIMFDNLLKKEGFKKEAKETVQKVSAAATPEQLAALQTSTFTEGPASFSEAEAKRLKNMTKAVTPDAPSPTAAGESLKDIKRSKKGLRG